MEITCKRDRWNQLNVSTHVDLGNQQQLRIETNKAVFSGGLRCSASVVTVYEGGYQHAFGSRDGTGDWSRTLALKEARGTEKALREFHAETIAKNGGLETIIGLARAHYAAQAARATIEKAQA